MELQTGMMVGAHVRLAHKLGEGGMASVWVADHLTLHTQVAVKFVSLGLSGDASMIERFRREATLVAKMKNPHVVQVFDHGVTPEGSPYMVMELLEGEDLGSAIKRYEAVPVETVVQVVSQTSKALSKAHALGLVHRDIKPENLFLTDLDGEVFVKVLDFGIAKETGARMEARSMTSTGSMVGTPYYMSPEQVLSAKQVDSGADLWSLAVVAYHALTGRVPFDAETVAGVFIAIEKGAFQPPSACNAALGPSLDAWFGKALNRDPSVRFATAKELAASFEQAAAGRSWDEAMTAAARAPFFSQPEGVEGAEPVVALSEPKVPPIEQPVAPPEPAEAVSLAGPALVSKPAPAPQEREVEARTASLTSVETATPQAATDTFEASTHVVQEPSSKLPWKVVGGVGAMIVVVGLLALLTLGRKQEPSVAEAGLVASRVPVHESAPAAETGEADPVGSSEAPLSVDDLPKAPAKPKMKPAVAATVPPVGTSKPTATASPTPTPKTSKEKKEYGF